MSQPQVVVVSQAVPNTIRLCDPLPNPVGYSASLLCVKISGLGLGVAPTRHCKARLLPTRVVSCFSGLPPEVAEAMCTPMHLILPSGPPSTPRLQCSNPGALYLGSISAVLDPSILKDHDIHHLVQVLDVPWLPASEQDGYECYRLDILDLESQDLRPHLEDAVEDIDSALRRGLNVLVHCQQGVSRSAAIVIAYLIRKRGMSFDSAITFVRQRRPCIKPNSGFVRCLREWERQWSPHSGCTPTVFERSCPVVNHTTLISSLF